MEYFIKQRHENLTFAKKSFGNFEFAAPASVAEPEKALAYSDVAVAACSVDQPTTSDSVISPHDLRPRTDRRFLRALISDMW